MSWAHRLHASHITGKQYIPPVGNVWLFVFSSGGKLLRAYRYPKAGSSAKIRIW